MNRIRMRNSLVLLTVAIAVGLAAGRPSFAAVLYASKNTGEIVQFPSAGVSSVLATRPDTNSPQGVAVDAQGNVYVVENGIRAIEKFTPDGHASIFAIGTFSARSLAFDKAGNLYAADGNTVERFTPNGVRTVYSTANLVDAWGLAFDNAGNLYVSNDYPTNNIVKFTPDGTSSIFATSGIYNAFCLACDRAGNLYAANWSMSNIEKFTPDGSASVFATTDPLPFGLAIDAQDNLYVSQSLTGAIDKFSPNGAESLYGTSAVDGTIYLATAGDPQPLTPVPEPSTLAFVGVATVFFIQRRRRATNPGYPE